MTRKTRQLSGIGVSSGFAFGRAHFVDRRALPIAHLQLEPDTHAQECERFDEAVLISSAQLEALKSQMKNAGEEHSLILDTHLLMLKDPSLVDGTKHIICTESVNAEWALSKTAQSVMMLFEHQEDVYFQERRADIGFVVDRLMRNLLGADQPSLANVSKGSVVVAKDLSPADMASLLDAEVSGFVTEVGGQTSHTAIMARALELPALVAVEDVTQLVSTGDEVIVDASRGTLFINPEASERSRLEQLAHAYERQKADVLSNRHQDAITLDGVEIAVWGNIESADEVHSILDNGASAVGLYRTEYLFIGRRALPDEEEQYEQYRTILETLGGRCATIRTIDLGGDKFSEHLKVSDEANPAMGTRAIRFCLLKAPDVFRTQLRALLRACAHGNLRIMVPFISRVEEILSVKAVMEQVKSELMSEGLHIGSPQFGVMIELPGAALIMDLIAPHVDFVSVGTNDLVQYTLAVDRANPNVSPLYSTEHPAVLRLVRNVLDVGREHGISVSVCGEMAAYPHCVPLLLGMGLRRFSVSPTAVPIVKTMLRSLSTARCEALASEVRTLASIDQINERLCSFLKEQFEASPLEAILKPIWGPVLKRNL